MVFRSMLDCYVTLNPVYNRLMCISKHGVWVVTLARSVVLKAATVAYPPSRATDVTAGTTVALENV